MAATLHNPTFLCTTLHIKTLLGVAEDPDHLLITCSGIVKCYNVAERRDVHSWTTKSWNPFSSPAVHHPLTNTISAVINKTAIIQWTHDMDDIDGLKKCNFKTPIQELLVIGDTVYVLFTTGHVQEITEAIKTCKDAKPGFLTSGDSIKNTQILKETKLLVMVVEKEGAVYSLCKVPLENPCKIVCETLSLSNASLTGVCVMSTAKLITLWSTGDIFTFDLEHDYPTSLPGKKHTTETLLDVTRNTRILELSHSHIVIIGLDKQDEGGLMVLRDIKFALCTSVRKLKLYMDPPLVWHTSRGLVVADGTSLALITFTVQESNLATVFGTRVNETQGSASEMCHNWVSKSRTDLQDIPVAATKNVFFNKSKDLGSVIIEIDRGALTGSLLAKEVVTLLIENKKLGLINEAVTAFTDIPESVLVDAILFYLQCKDIEFQGIFDAPHLEMEIEPLEKYIEDKVICPFSYVKAHFINSVLRKPFTDVQLLTELPRLPFTHSFSLIQYLHYLIASGQCDMGEYRKPAKINEDNNSDEVGDLGQDNRVNKESETSPSKSEQVPSLCQVGSWLGLLLDTNYHQLLMSSEVTVHRLLLSCFDHVANMRKFLEDLMDMEPLVRRVVNGEPLPCTSHSSEPYSIERLVLT